MNERMNIWKCKPDTIKNEKYKNVVGCISVCGRRTNFKMCKADDILKLVMSLYIARVKFVYVLSRRTNINMEMPCMQNGW